MYGTDLAHAAANVNQIVAHRGASSERPECTMAAIERAIAVGATAVEMDVRTSRDGVLFLLHDAILDRTTNGTGPAHEKAIADLQKLDAGSWFDPKYNQERIPTLREALAACRGRIDVLLDLKERGTAYRQAVAKEVALSGEPERTIIGVRTIEQARLFSELLPDSRLLGLVPDPASIEAFANAGVDMIRLWPEWLQQDPDLPEQVRQQGTKLHLNGTLGTSEEVKPLLRYAPDSLSSDDPRLLRQTLLAIARK